MENTQAKKAAYKHCLKAMWSSFSLFVIYECAVIAFRTLTAKTLGEFADNILKLNYTLSILKLTEYKMHIFQK
ncbi:MAG TPA: hypothetical protein PLM73_10420 [Petrotogaceae bacterium]|nr:hypothetical protein [Petrotogaceae bacterium]HQH33937.1 hypothetical protein [Petrotogaceae bacterium]